MAGGCGTPLTAFFRLNTEFKQWAIGGVDGALGHFRVDVSKLLYHSMPKYFTLRKERHIGQDLRVVSSEAGVHTGT